MIWNGVTGGRYNPVTDTWKSVSTLNAPQPRSDFTAVWTGTEMIIWGGWTGLADRVTNTGSKYDPEADTWTAISLSDAPSARYRHTAVWADGEMIIWGGLIGSLSGARSGHRYDPFCNTWHAISQLESPASRTSHTSVWTGATMIIYGGFDASTGFVSSDGSIYTP